MAEMMVETSANSPVEFVFGPERMGLHNEDLQFTKYRVSIPSNPDYNSLNLAAAVQILAYEIFKASYTDSGSDKQVRDLPSSDDIERLYIHLEKVLKDIRFLRPHQGETMQRLRHLLSRAEPDVLETNIIRGILSAIEKSLNLH
jgi:tRNA (cytidine32/uridine32-2'-O)-methyltransferase